MKNKYQAEHLNVMLAISSFILVVTGVTFIGYLLKFPTPILWALSA